LVPQSTEQEFNDVVANSKTTFQSWRNVPLQTRQRYLQDFLHLMRKNNQELAEIMSLEHGKIIADSLGDIQRGIECIEHASNINTIMLGETMENISRNVDCYSYRHPLGVCAGICPFNFPAMIPLWVFINSLYFSIDVPYFYCCWKYLYLKTFRKSCRSS
jgi:malonate-semialdehyde dehydrogenase (acetylating)/methylmalonate-semialdehyde dehydrogenase